MWRVCNARFENHVPRFVDPTEQFLPTSNIMFTLCFFDGLNDTKLHYKSIAITVFDVGDFKRKKHVQFIQNWSTHHEAKTIANHLHNTHTKYDTQCYWKYYSQTHEFFQYALPIHVHILNNFCNVHYHVPWSCPMLMYRHSTLYSTSTTMVTKIQNITLWLLCGWINKIISFCILMTLTQANLHGYISNLIAHTGVGISSAL
jgi:hypothetical protein